MTPKEKAEELIDKFTWHPRSVISMSRAKQSAIICVDEIIAETAMYTGNLNPKWEFWNEVKKEIELAA